MFLEGKSVIVSGVGPGLGSEVARLALRDGADVMIAARRGEALAEHAKVLDPQGERVAHQQADISRIEQCEALVEATEQRFGGVDALVQVAAVGSVGGLSQVTTEDWHTTLEVNLIGSTQMAKAAAEAMKRRGGGSIVLIGSQLSMLPLISRIAYASSKGALMTAMKFMAKELGGERIRVNSVVPTWMWGPPVQAYVDAQAEQEGVNPEEIISRITDGMFIKEIPADEDAAEAVLFFCSDRSRMITGQSLLVNSGEFMP